MQIDELENDSLRAKTIAAANGNVCTVAEHAKGSIFIFVGASHVMQPANILEMLRARGFTITRL